jgi:membrane protein YqaA with SNARE-associated domain
MDYISSIFLPLGWTGLFLYAFTEASFNPFPVEIIFIPLALASPENVFWLALVATIGSSMGAILGYYIGYLGKVAILERFFSEYKISKIHNLYNKYESWAVFIAGFTPIPFKLVTISGGAFYINFKKFIMFSILGRGMRFFLEALFILYFGRQVMDFLDRNFGLITIGVVGVLFIGYWLYKKFK